MKNLPKTVLGAFALACISLASCSSDEPMQQKNGDENGKVTNMYTEIPVAESAAGVTTSANDFALNVYKQISGGNVSNNICTSPYSLFVALSMAANADNGETRDQLVQLLGVEGESGIEMLNSYNSTLLEYLPKVDKLTTCMIVNSVWYNPSFQIAQPFGKDVENYYNASIFNISPSDNAGMTAMNKWISDNTAGMIPSLLDSPLSSNIALVNAAYFNGEWQNPFEESATEPGEFTNIDGSKGEAYYMYNDMYMQYCESDDMQVVRLPYGNSNFAMYAILPAKDLSLSSFVSTLTANKLSAIIDNMIYIDVTLRLPRFTAEYKEDVMSCMRALGLTSQSLSAALTQNNVAVPTNINTILHGTKIIVNEKGTEVAAATVDGDLTAEGPVDKVTLTFNRPFLYMIEEASTHTILFIGQQVKMTN